MKFKTIVVMAAAGILSFGGSFALTRFLKNTPAAAQAAGTAENAGTDNTTTLKPAAAGQTVQVENLSRAMTEKQLQNLIYDIRQQMEQYRRKEKQLEQQDVRIQTAKKLLAEDAERLQALQLKLSALLADIKQQQENLNSRLTEISDIEKANIQNLAGTYDKMEISQSSKIMMNMADNGQLADVVKILYYMNKRTAAELLGTIGNVRPELAGTLCLKLKQISESN